MTNELTDAAYEAALARGRAALALPHAIEARYDQLNHRLSIVFSTKLVISFDPHTKDILKSVPEAALASAWVTPGGDGLVFGDDDGMAVSLPGLLAKIIPVAAIQNAMAGITGKPMS